MGDDLWLCYWLGVSQDFEKNRHILLKDDFSESLERGFDSVEKKSGEISVR